MLILGAGMAGLLAAHAFRDRAPVVLEAAASLPDNHGALLRFRTDRVMRITGAPLRKVRVCKAVMERDGSLTDRCSLLHANAYSKKVTGVVAARSILDLAPVDRWVAGSHFLARLVRGVDVRYDSAWGIVEAEYRRGRPDIWGGAEILSTIPLPTLLAILGATFDGRDFRATPITSVQVDLVGVDIYQTVYVPWEEMRNLDGPAPYRVSFSGARMILEFVGDLSDLPPETAFYLVEEFSRLVLGYVADAAGEPVLKVQRYGKIVPLPRDAMRRIVASITESHGIYSVGRFATWRQLLLDDVADDLDVIRGLLDAGEYGRRLHYA